MRFALALVVGVVAASVALACGSSGDDHPAPIVSGGDAHVPPPPPPPLDDDGGDAAPPSPDISSSAKSLYESEDQIAVAPDGTLGVLYSFIGRGSEGMSYRFSTDDGTTWTAPADITLPSLFPGDPAITTDADGNFWAAFLGIHFGSTDVDYTQIFVAKAPKGSTKFGTPIMVSDPANPTKFRDHPKIYVTKAKTIVVAYLESDTITSGNGAGVAATSTNGTDFTQHALIGAPDATFANLFSLCEGATNLYATFFAIKGATSYDIEIRKSVDQGSTWSTSTAVSALGETPSGLDMRCAANGDDVWVAYGLSDSQPASEAVLDSAFSIKVAHSKDGAATFTERVEALDAKATPLSTLPELVRMDDGSLAVAYIAGQKEGDNMGSVRFTRAASGAAFGASTQVDGNLHFVLSRDTPTWLGDYWGFAARGKTLYFAYPQNTSGKDHIFFKKVTLP